MSNNYPESQGYPCPCCGYLTRSEPETGTHDICPVCRWEDDYAQFKDPTLAGGANDMSLLEARENFKNYGAKSLDSKSKVRGPLADEIPKNNEPG